MTRIVVLDGYTLNPGDLSWENLRSVGEITVYDRTEAEEIIERAADADIVLTNKTPLTKETLDQLRDLKYIGVLATGYNVVDVDAAHRRGIPVTNIPSYGTLSVAQYVFALLLELCHRIRLHSDSVRAGEWGRCKDFCYTKSPQMELAGKTLGLIGTGRIGLQTARIAEAFGMRVIALAYDEIRPGDNVERVSMETLLRESDVVSLHCPLTAETKGLVCANWLEQMKPTAYLINTSRGQLVNEHDLVEALKAGKLAGAALDVLSEEPPAPDNPLLDTPNCIITPHIAWATVEARSRLMEIAVENVRSFVQGQLQNAVN
ncbi:MAG: glycerate dehydrogenase [Paenibacillaceae bacterium]|jgi:glycerate dehydrogenase|nr:glycerate dehydrogenase [Paenibacillaceae bacterium]